MLRLIALDLAPGDEFVQALQRCFDDGDAAFPLDQRLGTPARTALLEALRPAGVIDQSGQFTQLHGAKAAEEGDALVVATSGTTGEARGVVLTHAAVRASALATSRRLGVDPTRDRWLCCLPVAHVGGLSVITRAIETETPLLVLDRFDPDAVQLAATEGGATLTSLVPTALGRLGERTSAAFRTILLGGSQIPLDRPSNTVATYGMTETGSGVVYDGMALEGVEVRVEAGEILLRGPMLLRCYRDDTDPKDSQGWFATGDGGSIGPDGHLVVDGRMADVIVTGGEKVWPIAIESILGRSEHVREVAVVGIADDEWGHRVVAFVVPHDPAAPPTLEELRALVRDELGGFAAPRELCLAHDLPRTSIGKVRRRELVRNYGLVGV